MDFYLFFFFQCDFSPESSWFERWKNILVKWSQIRQKGWLTWILGPLLKRFWGLGVYLQKLGELCVAQVLVSLMAKVQPDELAVPVEGNVVMNCGLAEDVPHILCKREKRAWFWEKGPSGILVSSKAIRFTARKRIYLEWMSSLAGYFHFSCRSLRLRLSKARAHQHTDEMLIQLTLSVRSGRNFKICPWMCERIKRTASCMWVSSPAPLAWWHQSICRHGRNDCEW